MTAITTCREVRSPVSARGARHPLRALLERTALSARLAVDRWKDRRETVRALAHLDERSLRDLGITPTPYWRASRGFRVE